jgi:hypothetical protein
MIHILSSNILAKRDVSAGLGVECVTVYWDCPQ